jgi:hypothetical protein
MILMTKDIIERGAYADIFRPRGTNLAYKLFVSGNHPTNVGQGLTRPVDEERRRKTFLSECLAYERAAQHPFLCYHIPHSFHRPAVADVTDSTGVVSHLYLLDCCYAMEYIDGDAWKLGELLDRPTHIEQALQVFREAGIRHLSDVSIFYPDDSQNFKFIDFAIEEFQGMWC